MNPKVKKSLLVTLSVFAVIFLILLILPFAFKGKITDVAKDKVNSMLTARVDFKNVDISFIRSFPHVSVKLEDFTIQGTAEFEKDTLLASSNVELVLNIKSLFSDTGYEIRKLQFNSPRVLAHVLPDGKANWDIMKVDSADLADTTAMSFNMKLQDFVISNAHIVYWDEEGNQRAVLTNLNHHTTGDLTADSSMLRTRTTIDSLDYWMEGVKCLSKANVEMNADINANLNDMIFTFSENSSRINAIPFSFAGWVKMLDEGYDMDLTLDARKVDFKAILSMVPAIYSTSFEGIKAGGDVSMTGFLKGKMIGDFYPPFEFKLNVADGWFQYPDLPESLKKMNVAMLITNPGKTMDETLIDISRFSFEMGGSPFNAQMRIAYPMSDPELTLKAVGKIDLGMIGKIYPLEAGTRMNGVLDMNLNLAGRMSYYDNNQYDKFKFGGMMNISNMIVSMKSMPQDISIAKANMVFNNRFVDLTAFEFKMGRNDMSASGKLENFVAYALKDKTLSGTLDVRSNYFNASDFMAKKDETKPAASKEKASKSAPADTSRLTVFEIPKNINFTMQAQFNQLVYESMNFTNAKGVLKVADGELRFQDMGLQAFGGNMKLNGLYSTADPQKPVVKMDLALNEVIFSEVFKQVETIRRFAPVFEKAKGKFSTKFSFNSLLKKDMMPDLGSVAGSGSFNTSSVGISNVPALTALASGLKRPELSNTTIKDLALMFEVKDGKLYTKPFDMKVADVKMNLSGSTALDKTIAYAGKVSLPDKLKLGQLSTVNFKIGGTFTKPKVELDLAGTMNTLVDDAKTRVGEEVNKKVDEAKEKGLEETRIRKENAMKAARAEADRIKAEAQKAGDKLIAEAQAQGDKLIEKATNPVTKKVAEASAKKLVEEARKKAADLNAKADAEANRILQQAEERTDF